jgi:hypothetical protein
MHSCKFSDVFVMVQTVIVWIVTPRCLLGRHRCAEKLASSSSHVELSSHINSEDEVSIVLRNIGILLQDYT